MATFRLMLFAFVGSVLILDVSGQTVIPSIDSEAIRTVNFKYLGHIVDKKIPSLLSEATAKHRNEVVIVYPDIAPMHAGQSAGPFRGVDLPSITANASVVLEGIPVSRASGPCAADTFVCSDYTVQVTRILKNQNVAILAGQNIIVARSGGEYKVNGINVVGKDEGFHLFKEGEKYLFFLGLIEQSGSFSVTPGRAFLESGGKFYDTRTTRGIDPVDESLFMQELSSAIKIPHREVQR